MIWYMIGYDMIYDILKFIESISFEELNAEGNQLQQ